MGFHQLPITEDPPNDLQPYGNTRGWGRNIKRFFSTQPMLLFHCAILILLVRIQVENWGITDNLMPFITQTAYGIREELKFLVTIITQKTVPIRDYIHVVDLAEAHVMAIKRLLNKQIILKFSILEHIDIPYSMLSNLSRKQQIKN